MLQGDDEAKFSMKESEVSIMSTVYDSLESTRWGEKNASKYYN
jgi:hypothetical protein